MWVGKIALFDKALVVALACWANRITNSEVNLIKKINLIDRSIYNPIAQTLFDEKIDSLLIPIIIKMKKDSLSSIEQISESKAGKNVFSSCIKFYKSRELNKIANKEYKKIKKIKNFDSLILIKNPAY